MCSFEHVRLDSLAYQTLFFVEYAGIHFEHMVAQFCDIGWVVAGKDNGLALGAPGAFPYSHWRSVRADY